ncbi:MAG: HAD-IIIC family phosphatase [Clostridiales bacterium]|jgi:FkbH-like protein|nr:HAD-IIIC family phosphatase [Clostridiales bacterium]
MCSKSKIKCVVWDLDNTLWKGVLTEEEVREVDAGILHIIKTLDERGILQSISSKNNFEQAKAKLEQFGIWEYFIYPQINWNPKSQSIENIAKQINIGIDSLAFVDDQPFELEEVFFSHPEVLCLHVDQAKDILNMDCFKPKFITSDSKNRRLMYQNDICRNNEESDFQGTSEEFLQTLGMVLKVAPAVEADLERMEELTVRTHQLNSTGYIYSYDELKDFIKSDNYEVLVAQLDDKFGSYGKIGLVLIEKQENTWELKLLLMSCRVMSKGVGNVLLNLIMNKAKENGVALRARFVPTDRNRMMYATYKFNGFKEIRKKKEFITLAADLVQEKPIPGYLKVDLAGLKQIA